MYMNSYMIQYPITYSNYNALQRPIVCNSNVVKNNVCTTIKPGEHSNKQNAKDMQPRWCLSGLSHTQKRRLQRLRKRGAMEQQIDLRLVPHSKKEVAKTMQARSNGAAD
jgi:hypothetical protein